jgi:hypothetical protein
MHPPQPPGVAFRVDIVCCVESASIIGRTFQNEVSTHVGGSDVLVVALIGWQLGNPATLDPDLGLQGGPGAW